jgi:hypothetical protein
LLGSQHLARSWRGGFDSGSVCCCWDKATVVAGRERTRLGVTLTHHYLPPLISGTIRYNAMIKIVSQNFSTTTKALRACFLSDAV